MKKILSILIIAGIMATFFAGCNTETPTPVDPTPISTIVVVTPTPEVPTPTPTPEEPTPTPIIEPQIRQLPIYSNDLDDVIEFRVYNSSDYMTVWTETSKEWMLQNYHLKLLAHMGSIPAIHNVDVSIEDGRKAYNEMLSRYFASEQTRPDYMPALRGTASGVDACFKELGPQYLVDLNPYIDPEVGIFKSYVNWVWGGLNEDGTQGMWTDERAYWEQAKKVLEVDGKLYALPRREMMPSQNYLGYATKMLEQINISEDELPTTWDGFVNLLTAFKKRSRNNYPFAIYKADITYLLQFVASTYGIDFNKDFHWTQKNGEPLWSYCLEEYRDTLKRVRELADAELVRTTVQNGHRIVINANLSTPMNNAVSAIDMDAKECKSIAMYATSLAMARISTYGNRHLTEWTITDKMISQAGKRFSVIGTSLLDGQTNEQNAGGYIAIGNRLGEEFTLRILDMLRYSASESGYINYFFGREGSPFADTVEEAGNIVYDENGKIRIWTYGRDDTWDKAFWVAQDKHAEVFDEWPYNDAIYSQRADDRRNYALEHGITDTGFWPSADNYILGTTFQADITSWPMRLTTYWENDAMSKDEPNINKVLAESNKNNTRIYDGMYMSAYEAISGSDGIRISDSINVLNRLAKEFTVDYLQYKKNDSDWDNYIKSLNDAGYADVYEFHKNNAYFFMSDVK